jgi:hypothetical protein
MAACRLAARGKSMADAGYNTEVESLRRLMQMQAPTQPTSPQHHGQASNGHTRLPPGFEPDEFVPARCSKKRSKQQVRVVLVWILSKQRALQL